MKVLVLSDTHGNVPLAFQAHTIAEPVDTIIHLGDGTEDAELLRQSLNVAVVSVAGNCDLGSNAPRELLWKCEGKRLLLVHGDVYGVNNGLGKLEKRAIEVKADAVLYGHSHYAMVNTRSGILFVNPGTLIRTSRHHSFAVIEISENGFTTCLHNIS
jgi:putative phosphoesterase